MAIPEAQLDTWSGIGSIQQSSTTYNSIKNKLEAKGAGYSSHLYSVFLQGSYGNDTNIYRESDVDLVICLEDAFQSDLSNLPQDQRDAHGLAFPKATYDEHALKRDVLAVLTDAYGSDVDVGKKAITIAANGSRRKADVVCAVEYRNYTRFHGVGDQDFHCGIAFRGADGQLIANYPKQHSANCTRKHQATGQVFKKLVRILKNLRNRLVNDGLLSAGVAPSYYIEGLLYNVPDEKFVGSFQDAVSATIYWLQNATARDKFVCANERYYLLRDGLAVCWNSADCDKFLSAVALAWNNWKS